MTVKTSAGSTLALVSNAPATFNAAGFGALSFAELGEVTSIDGDLGRTYNVVTHNPLKTRGTVKLKGSYNSGSLTIQLGLDRADAGQIAAQAALASDSAYSFKLTLQDGRIFYFRGLVMSFPVNVSGVDAVTNASITIEITVDASGADFVEV